MADTSNNVMSGLTENISDEVMKKNWDSFMAGHSKTAKPFAYFTLGITILGLFGNALCAKVMGKVQHSVKGTGLIRYLTIVDILVLALYVTPSVIASLVSFQPETSQLDIFNCVRFLLKPFGETVYSFEIYLTVLIAIQRCLSLAVPLWFKRVMRESVIHKILIGIGVSAVALNIPNWAVWSPTFYWNTYYNMTLIRPNVSLSPEFEFYWTIALMIFSHGIPAIVLVVSTIILIISRRRMIRFGGRKDRIAANQLTAIVLAIAVMSCVVHSLSLSCFTAQGFKNYIQLYFVQYGYSYIDFVLSLRHVTIILVCINSSTNFVFYCTFGREFRRTLMAMFQRGTSHLQAQQVAIELGEVHARP